MELSWSLKELYESFECEKFKEDMKRCKRYIEDFDKMSQGLANAEPVLAIETYINTLNEFSDLIIKLMNFAQLTISVDTKNEKAMHTVEELEAELAKLAEPTAKLEKWIGSLSDLNNIINSSEILKGHAFYIREVAEKSKYILSDKEEAVIASMQNTGSNAWSKLQDLVTSTLMVDININGKDKKLPLTVIRNMAYDKNSSLRKKAYEAEINAYKKIEDTSAACLNGIKGEVITLSRMRGYKSPLEKTLKDSRMDLESLEAMLSAIKDSMPAFHKYFRKKAELLGHKEGLPFYDLFAPIGEANMEFSFDEARKFVVDNFRTFSGRLADFADNAFEKRWIDAEPKEGKVGGAFCSNIHGIKESRVMCNFGNTFSDVVTIAHELGHAYHGDCLNEESALNSNYPMPIAETASTFCETIVKKAAVKGASDEEAFAILENEISDCAQVIVDIYSRYLFETELFRRREKSSLSPIELKEIMLNAQREAYGDGLDHNYLHPYMWICKSHYYYAEANFYNFPYAFGLLFAKGLYAEYLKRGNSFVKDYDKLLAATGKNKIADITAMMDIDIHSKDFWKKSLNIIESDIDKFLSLR